MTDNDAVSAAFAHMRQEAKKRTGTVPDLNRPLPKASKSLADNDATPAVPKQRGIATGPDGRRRRRSYSVQRAGSILSDEIKKRGWRKEIAGGWVNSHWDDLVGAQIAAHTKVEMFKDKALFITCDSTAWATNLRMMQRIILRSISEQIGPDIIVELKIFGPKAPSWRHGPLHVKGRGPRDTYG